MDECVKPLPRVSLPARRRPRSAPSPAGWIPRTPSARVDVYRCAMSKQSQGEETIVYTCVMSKQSEGNERQMVHYKQILRA